MARILVVDDEPDLLETVRRILTRSGHDVVAVGSGAEALRELEARPSELVLTDLMMPGVDGLALVARVRELEPVMPKHLREEVYNWLALMPGLRGPQKELRKEFERNLQRKVEKGLL